MISTNVKVILEKIARSCEISLRQASDVTLVCVTKTVGIDQVEELIRSGQTVIGENRVQDAMFKHSMIKSPAAWHLIGHLQTNKARDAVKLFDLIHSVDSLRLAKEIDKEAAKIAKVQDILLQVNTSGEISKFGLAPDEAIGLLKDIAPLKNIRPIGFMTMAPEVEDAETVRPYFKALKKIRDSINKAHIIPYELKELSMGMSNDFEVAVEEGSTMVRVGRALFA